MSAKLCFVHGRKTGRRGLARRPRAKLELRGQGRAQAGEGGEGRFVNLARRRPTGRHSHWRGEDRLSRHPQKSRRKPARCARGSLVSLPRQPTQRHATRAGLRAWLEQPSQRQRIPPHRYFARHTATEATEQGVEHATIVMSTITTIQTLSDLEAVVTDWEDKFFDPGLGYPSIWYRGQPRDLPPQPGVLRPKFLACCDGDEIQMRPTGQRLWNRERTINRQFRRMSASLVPAGSSHISLYFLAQHHGLPTRLLDWSMNPLAAVYFAASGSLGEDGVVFVMNSKDLGSFAEMRDTIVEATASALFDDGNIVSPAKIIPLLPDLFAGRMLQQASCFTFHTPPMELNDDKLDIITPASIPNLEKHIIPKDAKPKLLLTLRRLGITDATLFPDLDHVAKEVRSAWRV